MRAEVQHAPTVAHKIHLLAIMTISWNTGANLLEILGGDEGVDSKCLAGRRGRMWERVHLPQKESGTGQAPSQKNDFWCILSGVFCPGLHQKNVEFSA